MTVTATRPATGLRVLRGVGWTLIGLGVLVGLYLVYALGFTNLETDRAQRSLEESWASAVGAVDDPRGPSAAESGAGSTGEAATATGSQDGPADGAETGALAPTAVATGEAMAVLQFRRRGAPPPVTDEAIYVVEGTSVEALKRGPGHYPETAAPGAEGNFGVAGHRTTFGAPFYNLDELEARDEVLVTDRAGRRHTYRVVETRIVRPDDSWVLADDPLGTGAGGMLTLTTCHPRFSAAQRMIVFAELVA